MSTEFVPSPRTTGLPGPVAGSIRPNEPVPCQHCGSPNTKLATRTDYFDYVRCSTCCQVWSVPSRWDV